MKACDIYGTCAIKDNDYEFKEEPEVTYLPLETINKDIEYGRLSEFPMCCGYAVYANIIRCEIEPATDIIKQILEANNKAEHGFGAVLATEVEDELIEKLLECGWETISTHLNYGSGNTITTLIYKLKK